MIPVVFTCKRCKKSAHCGPSTRRAAYQIHALQEQLHRDCGDLLRLFKRLHKEALQVYGKAKRERPDMKYDVGFRYGYYKGMFQAYLVTKYKNRNSMFGKSIEGLLEKQKTKQAENQLMKDFCEDPKFAEADGQIDGTVAALKAALKIEQSLGAQSCVSS